MREQLRGTYAEESSVPAKPKRDAWDALSERVRFMAGGLLTLFLLGWTCWFFPFDDLLDRSGTPLGADYAMFYVAGSVVADGNFEKLYDQGEHQQRLQALFPNIDPQFCLPYRYPPVVAVLAAPLSRLPYAWSFAVFSAGSLAAWFGSLALLSRNLPVLQGRHRGWLLCAAVAWPVAFETVLGGQASMLSLLIAVGCLIGLQRGNTVLAGALLALACCKPNVLLLFGLGAIVYRPRLLLGAVPVGLVLVGIGVVGAGWEITLEYANLATSLATTSWTVETPPWKVHSLAAWIGLLAPGQERLLCAGLGAALASWIGWRWRNHPGRGSLAISLLLVTNAACNPYTPIYDLCLLLAAAIYAADYYLGDARDTSGPPSRLAWTYAALLILYFGPHFSQGLAKAGGPQWFPLALLTCAACQIVGLMQAPPRQAARSLVEA